MTQERQQAIPIPQEQILAMLQTRGFESGFSGTPLRDFWGTLTSVTGEMRQGQRGAFAVSLYNFEDVEVLRSTEPYTSTVAQIEIPVSTKDKSKMGYFGGSIDGVINAGIDKSLPHGSGGVKNQNYLLGKQLHLTMTPGHMIPARDEATGKWEDKPQDCWVLVEMSADGAAPVQGMVVPQPSRLQPTEVTDGVALAFTSLNGKTIQQWHQEVFSLPSVKKDPKLINQIISGEFIGGLEAAGRVVKDANNVYHVTG